MDGIVARTVMLYDPDRFTKFVRFVTKVGLFHFTISRFGNISQNILGGETGLTGSCCLFLLLRLIVQVFFALLFFKQRFF